MKIQIGGEEKEIEGEDLISILKNFSAHLRLMEYLDRIGLWEDMVHFLLDRDVESADQFSDEEFVENLKTTLSAKDLILGHTRPCRWKPSCYEFDAAVKDKAHLVFTIGPDIPLIPEYRNAIRLYPVIKEYLRKTFVLHNGTQQIEVANWRELLETTKKEAFKGYSLQRYKGLGEMNPEQLWETTMNPDKRTLLQVKIEDAEKADDIFTTLMGDKVEPRREFIQNHALEVTSLDI
jgi:DNA gyrase subunit B